MDIDNIKTVIERNHSQESFTVAVLGDCFLVINKLNFY